MATQIDAPVIGAQLRLECDFLTRYKPTQRTADPNHNIIHQ